MSSVYERIRSKIVRNEMPPGGKINIDALVRELGVSQTPVREALHHLEGDGLVQKSHGRGYSTTSLLSDIEFRHMFEVRLLIEPWSARVVATDRMSNPGHDLVEFVDLFRELSSVSRNELAQHDEAFHTRLHAATANRFLIKAYSNLHAQLHLFRLFADGFDETIEMQTYADATAAEHRDIAVAIANCDPDRADTMMRRHLVNSFKRFDPKRGQSHTSEMVFDEVPRAKVAPPLTA